MAYRCQSCGYFASLEEPDFDPSEPEFDGSQVAVDIEASYPSACCNDEVATQSYRAVGTLEFEHAPTCDFSEDDTECDYQIELTGDPEATDRFEHKDRHGKPIKNSRYRRHYYGVEAIITVTCPKCAVDAEVPVSDEQGPPEESY